MTPILRRSDILWTESCYARDRSDRYRVLILHGSGPPNSDIGLTEAMIEAGIDAYYAADFDPGSPFSLRETVARIYRAMRAQALAARADRAADPA
jgi:hypothetical protein